MFAPKHIAQFVLKCFLCYLILLVAGHYVGIENRYIQQCRKVGNKLFVKATRTGQVNFLPTDQPNYDTELLIKGICLNPHKRGKALDYKGLVSLKTTAYLPFLFLLSLIFATTFVQLKEKMKAVLGGFLLLHFYVMILLYIRIQFIFYEGEQALGKQTTSFFDQIIAFFNQIMVEEVRLLMVVPIIVWVIVCFNRKTSPERVKTIKDVYR